jgi:hypothetical protein
MRTVGPITKKSRIFHFVHLVLRETLPVSRVTQDYMSVCQF